MAIRENIRPDWLITELGERLELDFYIEEWNTAIEVQGQQHYVYTPFFHKSYDDFLSSQRRDNFKKRQCSNYGIQLIEVSDEDEVMQFISLMVIPKEIKPVDKKIVYRAFKLANKQVKQTQEWLTLCICKSRHKRLVRQMNEIENRKGLPGKKRILKRIRAEVREAKNLKRQATREFLSRVGILMIDLIL